MKPASAGHIATLAPQATEETTFTWCCKLIPPPPLASIPLTSLDVALESIDIGDGEGAMTYQPDGGFLMDALSQDLESNVNTANAQGFFIASGIDPDDLFDGYYDNTVVYLFLIDYTTPGNGIIKFTVGWLGEVKTGQVKFTAELRDLFSLLQQKFVNIHSETCRVITFGDPECMKIVSPNDWTLTTAYAVGDVVAATTPDGRQYEATIAGTSGGTEPTWDTTIDNLTVDNTVTWITKNGLFRTGTVGTVTSQREFTITGMTAPVSDDIYSEGSVVWTSGTNNGKGMDTYSWVDATSTVILRHPMRRTITAGDTVTFKAGCSRNESMCIAYDNLINMRGETHMPNEDVIFAYQRPS